MACLEFLLLGAIEVVVPRIADFFGDLRKRRVESLPPRVAGVAAEPVSLARRVPCLPFVVLVRVVAPGVDALQRALRGLLRPHWPRGGRGRRIPSQTLHEPTRLRGMRLGAHCSGP